MIQNLSSKWVRLWKQSKENLKMAASALTTSTAAALTSTLPESASKSNQQSPRNTASVSSVAVRAGLVEVSKALQEGEKFIKWDEVSAFATDNSSSLLMWIYLSSKRLPSRPIFLKEEASESLSEYFFLLHEEINAQRAQCWANKDEYKSFIMCPRAKDALMSGAFQREQKESIIETLRDAFMKQMLGIAFVKVLRVEYSKKQRRANRTLWAIIKITWKL